MYIDYFGFHTLPFHITRDERFIFASTAFSLAYDAVIIGLQAKKQWVILTGEAGTGKTVLLNRLTKDPQYHAGYVRVSYGKLNFEQLIGIICDQLELVVENEQPAKNFDAFVECLARRRHQGEATVLVIDEAQNLADSVLEELVPFTIEVGSEPLLQILMVGQPALEAAVNAVGACFDKPSKIQYCRLTPLDDEDISRYIQHRLAAAGCERTDLFTPQAVALVGQHSRGIPRIINIICGHGLLVAFNHSEQTVTDWMIEEAASRLELHPRTEPGAPAVDGATQVIAPSTAEESPDAQAGEESTPLGDADKGQLEVYRRTARAPAARPFRGLRWAFGTLAIIGVVWAGSYAVLNLDWFAAPPETMASADVEEAVANLQAVMEQVAAAREERNRLMMVGRTYAEAIVQLRKDVAQMQTQIGEREEKVRELELQLQHIQLNEANARTATNDEALWHQQPTPSQESQNDPLAIEGEPGVSLGKSRQSNPLVDTLLAQAHAHVKANRLTAPAGNNALHSYRLILHLAPDHQDAQAGIDFIKQRFIGWAKADERRGQIEKARRHYQEALAIDPDDRTLLATLQALDARSVKPLGATPF